MSLSFGKRNFLSLCQTLTGHTGYVQGVVWSADGRMLASCGDDNTIQVWDLQSGQHLQTLRRDRPYERLDSSGIRGLTQAEIATLQALGAVEDAAPDAIS